MLLAGYLSVRLFRNSKPLTNTLFLALTIILLIAYWYVPSGNEYLWLNYTILILLGLAVYGPVMFIGLYSMELVPKEAAGAASGCQAHFPISSAQLLRHWEWDLLSIIWDGGPHLSY